MKKLAQLALGMLIVTMIACDKKGSDPAPAPVATQYGYNGSTCYDLTTNQPVAASLCSNVVINGGYRWNGVTCIDANGAQVSQSFCNMNGVSQIGNSNYRWTGTQCLDVNNNVVGNQLCQPGATGMNGMFQIVGNNCMHTYTGQWVSYQYCAGVTGYNANTCQGWHTKFYGAGAYVRIYCSGSLCSGQTMISDMTGQQVTCP
ncbi:MAG: hypothetical protein JNL11_01940 [Bdellovibrionaceae bacterium]|nr:hypothetical protein [Pseudobdellovibrionaceae bacterium]